MATVAEKERILVVDDAADALELIERNLTASGYRVFTAPGAGEPCKRHPDTWSPCCIPTLANSLSPPPRYPGWRFI